MRRLGPAQEQMLSIVRRKGHWSRYDREGVYGCGARDEQLCESLERRGVLISEAPQHIWGAPKIYRLVE